MRIQHNILAMNAYRNYNTNTKALAGNLEKLSSGYKINRAGDDAAGLAISEKMRAQIKGLEAAQKNVKDGTSLVKTAEGAMQEIQDMLGRMKYLATQSANGTYDDAVDRKNLQAEVDQLRSEINRIADSANFNGIKLLDGKMGLNEDAFAFSEAAYVEASDGKIAGSSIAQNDPATLHTEKTGVSTAVEPGFTIDLNDLAFTATDNSGSIKLNVLGKEFTITTTKTGSAAGDADYLPKDIAKGLVDQMKLSTADIIGVDKTTGVANGTPTSNDAVKIGDMVFSFTAAPTDGKIAFTYEGYMKGTTYVAKGTDSKFTAEQAKAINEKLGAGVKVVSSDKGDLTGSVIHDTTNVTYAQAISPSSRAGVDIDLSSIIGHENTLTIDGQTYMFQTKKLSTAEQTAFDAKATANGGVKIDVSAGKDLTEQIHMAVDALSKQVAITGKDVNADGTVGNANGRIWTISSAGATKIHIDQTADTTDTTKALKDFDSIAAIISASKPATSEKFVGTTISVTNDNVNDGDGLTVDGKKYVFTDDKELLAKTGGDTTYVAIKGGAAKNLAAKISGSEFDETANTVTVRAADADAKAPVVLGKGLQLQIGDTSESFNQMGVLVNDMHTVALGIDTLSIADPESASAAIQTVMDAINSVSSTRGTLGALQNRLDHTANNLSVMAENIQDAESTIRDTDVAEEMMAYTKNNILVQSAQAMLAQANAVPQGVLQLLG